MDRTVDEIAGARSPRQFDYTPVANLLHEGPLAHPRLWSNHNVSSWQPGMLVVAVTEENAYKGEGSKGDYARKPTLRKANRLPNSLGLCLLTTAQPSACAGWGMHVVRTRGGYTDNC